MALSRSSLGTSFGVTSCQTGAAIAPPTPSANVVMSRVVGSASPPLTITAKAIEIAATAACAPISRRRASTMSASAPAGTVKRNIGSMVATWTAETIIGLGLRFVISQLIDVSNIAMPTLDTELAIRMTVNARWPNTPHRDPRSADGPASSLDWLVNRRSALLSRWRPWGAAAMADGKAFRRFQAAAAMRRRRTRSYRGTRLVFVRSTAYLRPAAPRSAFLERDGFPARRTDWRSPPSWS